MAHRYIPTGQCFPRHSLPGNWIGQDVGDLNHCPHGPQTPTLSITEGCGLLSSDSYRHPLVGHKCYEEYGENYTVILKLGNYTVGLKLES